MGLGLDLNGPKSWVLTNGLGFRLGLRYFGLRFERFRVLGLTLKKFSGSLAFGTRIFSSSGFRCEPVTESTYSLPPWFFENWVLKSDFWKSNIQEKAVKIKQTTYLTFKLRLGRQSLESEFEKSNAELTGSIWNVTVIIGFSWPDQLLIIDLPWILDFPGPRCHSVKTEKKRDRISQIKLIRSATHYRF